MEACSLEGHLIRICYINTVPPSQKIALIIKLLYLSACSVLPSSCHSHCINSSSSGSSKVISPTPTPTLFFGYRAFVPKSIRSLHWLGKQKLIKRLSTHKHRSTQTKYKILEYGICVIKVKTMKASKGHGGVKCYGKDIISLVQHN